MATLFRWLMRVITGLIALGVLMIGLVYYLGARSLPQYEQSFSAAGISSDIEIIRDNHAVPHIFAAADRDVFFGLGYAHAQDRLWQMTLLRRTAQGRLSEVFGARTVETDKVLRRLDLYPLSVQSVAHQDPRTLDALESYAAGVNARLAQVNRDSLGRGAPEFFLFDAPIAPWKPADSIAIVKLMALQLSGHLEEEVIRARSSLLLADESRLADILPDIPDAGVAALPDYAALVPGAHPGLGHDTAPAYAFLNPAPRRGLAGASNAWAAAPHRAANKGTLLANDPHLGFTAPAIWYLARLELGAGGVMGASIPGVPTLMIGRSDAVGWGLTSSYLDDADLFVEEVNPDNREQYRTPTGWKEFRTRKSIINIADAAPITITLRWTDNGPVLPGTHFDLGTVTPPGHVMALGWTALSPRDTSVTAAVNMLYATNVDEALRAGQDYIAPSQNLTVADRQTVAMKVIGAMPRRDADHQSQGRMPSLGWRTENRWQGRMDYAQNPAFVSPPGGIVGNTNNKTVDQAFPDHVSFVWGDSQRVQRWRRLMQGRQVHTRDSFIEAQLDTVSPTARGLLPLIAADLWFTGESAPEGTREQRRKQALDLLANWNGEMNEHLPEPLIYAAWLRALQDRLIRDELGALADEFVHVEPLFLERVYRDVEGASVWCDVLRSAPVESCTTIAQLSLDDALVWIAENHGTALEALRWGDAHQATHDHPVLGEVPLLRYFVNIRQSTSGGDNTLLRGRTSGLDPDPFLNVHGAGYRGVYDFADPNSSVFVNSTGQSGHVLSRHYDDLGVLWRRGEYIPMSLDIEVARAASVGVTRISND
ncbi:MAG: penicillin acylase family protein [Rhodobacteraceae bacterium]|nr:penicillin acylase family protein [Paracoccaceae bacterium]